MTPAIQRSISAAALIAAALAITTTTALATGADDSAPKLVKAELVTAPEINHGTSAVVIRTTHRLDRGRNGGTLRGRAGVGGPSSSLTTVHGPAGHPCYVAYVTKALRPGRSYEAVIQIGERTYHRTLTLKHPKHVAERGADLGC